MSAVHIGNYGFSYHKNKFTMRRRFYQRCPRCGKEVLYPAKHVRHRHRLLRHSEEFRHAIASFTRSNRFKAQLNSIDKAFLSVQDPNMLDKSQRRAVRHIFHTILNGRFRLSPNEWSKLAPFADDIRNFNIGKRLHTLIKKMMFDKGTSPDKLHS
jgi:hypothetical protein